MHACTGIEDTEAKVEQRESVVEIYLNRVGEFLTQIRAWCDQRGLLVEDLTTPLNEEGTPPYVAPGLGIRSPDGGLLARLIPVGASVIAAQGRIDMVGSVGILSILYQTRKSLMITARRGDSIVTKPLIPGVGEDGWYWLEASLRRARFIDESRFFDLLADVSNYEWE